MMMKNYYRRWPPTLAAFACLGFLLTLPALAVDTVTEKNEQWLLIDIAAQRLILFDGGNHALKVFHNIAIGSGGVSQLHFRGDMTTPVGHYRVTHINLNSRYRAFIGLDYPTTAHAKLAYFLGKIPKQDFNRLLKAPRNEEPPPDNTALGGMIGIHALGDANLAIHQRINWTDGCIALNNDQMDALLPYVYSGMRVVIR